MNKESISDKFNQFDRDNPGVYNLFKDYALKAVQANKKKASARMIIEVIRWEHFLKTESDDEYKINNNYTPFYARKFVTDYPEYEYLFNFRNAESDQEGPAHVDKDGQTSIF